MNLKPPDDVHVNTASVYQLYYAEVGNKFSSDPP